MQTLPLNMPFLLLRIGVIFVLGVILWLGLARGRKTKQKFQEIQKQLDASFTLSGYLLEAQDEGAAILAAMRAGHDLLQAEGCAFVPFNEWKQSLPALKYGEAPFLQDDNWQARLSEPATRHTCRNCEIRQAGAECVLLQPPADLENVYCVALRCGGREIGVINYFFSDQPQITENQHLFLNQMVRMTDLAIDSIHMHTQELNALRAGQQVVVSDEAMGAESQAVFEQLKYQAVLEERTRLAREIHDGLAQTLAFLKMEASRLQNYVIKGETTSITETLQAYYVTLSDAYLDVRQTIDNLRRIPDESMADWLTVTASDFKALTGLNVDVTNVELDHVFPSNIRAQLIRIVQEALTNIRKHAQGCTVIISAFERAGEAIIEVKDNGRGFAPEDVDTAAQYGLRSMRERAESIDADFQIISAPGMGTTIRLQIPIREKANL